MNKQWDNEQGCTLDFSKRESGIFILEVLIVLKTCNQNILAIVLLLLQQRYKLCTKK